MAKRPRQFFEFGKFHLDVERSRLIKNGELVSLPPKAVTLLLLLVKHSGRAVEKEELMETLWPNGMVEDSNLTQTVHLLRKAIGKDPDSDVYIETLPRFGYRLMADVRELWSEGLEHILNIPSPAAESTVQLLSSAATEITLTKNDATLLQADDDNSETISTEKTRQDADEKNRFSDVEKHNFGFWLKTLSWLKSTL